MNSHLSLTLPGWELLLEQLARFATSPIGAELCRHLRPETDRAAVAYRQAQTLEMQALLRQGWQWQGPPDLRVWLRKIPAQPAERDLQDLLRLCEQARTTRQYLQQAKELAPHVWGLCHQLPSLDDLEKSLRALKAQAPAGKIRLDDDFRRRLQSRQRALQQVLQQLGELDRLYAKVSFAHGYAGQTVRLAADHTFDLRQFVHPLLAVRTGQAFVSPITVMSPATAAVTLITGPHESGKTTLLEALGLAVLMHQSGLLLPCQPGSSLPLFSHVLYWSQQETYRIYLKGLQEIVRRADAHTLFLSDDLAAGSNPGEAYALARAALEHLAQAGVKVFGTTHHAALRHSARQHPHMQHWGLQVNKRKGQSVYALGSEVDGLSQSLEFAQAVGLPPRLLQQAREHYRALSGASSPPAKVNKPAPVPRSPSPLKDPALFRPKPSGLNVGDTVYIQAFQQYGEVLTLPDRQDQVDVLWGDKKVSVPVSELLLSSKRKLKKGDSSGIRIQTWSVATDRCDLHNLRVHEAMPVLEKFLDTAYYEGLSPLFIIHGKGEGALKQAVRAYLKAAPQVLGFRDGQVGEGDGGVTVVDLRLN